MGGGIAALLLPGVPQPQRTKPVAQVQVDETSPRLLLLPPLQDPALYLWTFCSTSFAPYCFLDFQQNLPSPLTNESVLPEGTHLFLSRYFPSPKTYMAGLALLFGTVLAALAFFLAAGSGTGAGSMVAMLVIFGIVLGGGWYIVAGWHRDELNDYQAGVR